jgi:hypothetical protein
MTRGYKIRATRKSNTCRKTAWALRKIRKHQPKTLLETSKLGLVLVHVGNGTFRESYRITGTPLLIKFPIVERFHDDVEGAWITYRTDDTDGKSHSRAEIRKIQKLSQFKSIRPHLPPVYYFNSKDGVMVTKYFCKIAPDWTYAPMLSAIIRELTHVALEDLFGDNVRLNEKDVPIFVDLGY